MNRKIEQLISFPFYFLVIPAVAVWVHHSMTKGDWEVKKLKRASFQDIKEKMLQTKWKFDENNPCSLFDANNFTDNYFHAGIFRFGDIGYLLTLYGLVRANILQRQIRKQLAGWRIGGKPYV